MSTGTPFPHKK